VTFAAEYQGFESLTPSGTNAFPTNFGPPGFPTDASSGNTSGQTIQSDSTRSAHGTLSLKVATGATATLAWVGWNTSVTWASTMYLRAYMYFAALPTTNSHLLGFLSGGVLAARWGISTGGKIICQDSTFATKLTSTNAPNTAGWFRLEGWYFASATVGQMSFSLYNSMDSTTATESQTSPANLNTLAGNPDTVRYGLVASQANWPATGSAYWVDDIGVSSLGPVGAYSALATATDASNATVDGGPGAGGVPLIGVDDAVGFP
jgi:hypothetical protein